MKVTRQAKRRVYTPRRTAQLHFAAVFNQASKAIGSAFLERVDAVVAPVVSRLIAGSAPGPLGYVGTGNSSIGWRGLPQNIAKPAVTAPARRPAPGKPR